MHGPRSHRRVIRVFLFLLMLGLAPATRAETLTGQVVCSQCWFEADRGTTPYGTAADLDCAGRCAARGIGSALAVRDDEGRFELYALQGSPPGGGPWLAWIGRFVRAEGAVALENDAARFRAVSLEALATTPWPQSGDGHRDEHEGHGHEDDHDAAPSWTDLRGRPIDLGHWGERIVVVNFWATWCRPCIREMPDLVKLRNRFAPYGVEFVGAAADEAEQSGTVLEYVRRHRINFPVVLGATTDQMEAFGLPPTLPATVVLDEHGHQVAWYPGVIDPRVLEEKLATLLGLSTASSGKSSDRAQAKPHRHHHGTEASLVPS